MNYWRFFCRLLRRRSRTDFPDSYFILLTSSLVFLLAACARPTPTPTPTATMTPSPTLTPIPTATPTLAPSTAAQARVLAGYYAGWSADRYPVSAIPADLLTHVFYAF